MPSKYVIYVRASRKMIEKVNLLMYGDGQRKTMVSMNENYVNGFTTINTATFNKQNQAASSSSNQPQLLLLLLLLLLINHIFFFFFFTPSVCI
ncbi:pectinesterase/pectinesterase inhibitor 28 [Canna indica]|uniref:Pectinesterase/pectinesterase inhibitor 28 n=1 Tax=Canna indica TaxID=4628 RepID=A0AAQ3JPC3_9LILI|nr:pectinesterase/pectinesterase inhibitor 28 [Canna indica]